MKRRNRMKNLILSVVTSVLMVASAMAKQSISKVSAKADQDGLTVSYTLSEDWSRNYGGGYDECSECYEEECYQGYVRVFGSKSEATEYDKSPWPTIDPIEEFYLEDDDRKKGTRRVSFDFESRELWQQYPNAAVLVEIYDSCAWLDPSKITNQGDSKIANIDFSAVEGATEEALRIYRKAQTLSGIVEFNNEYSGTVTLKLGAINKKKGTVKVTAAYTPFIGKKETASQTVAADEDGYLSGSLSFKCFDGPVAFEVGLEDEELSFYAEGENCNMWMERIGGAFDVEQLEFYSSLDLYDPSDDYEWLDITPDGMEITVAKGTKWSLPKVPTVKYKKMKEDDYTWYELTGLDDEVKTNVSGLKLSYTAKTGVFKGSYTIYASNESYVDEGKSPTLKKYKVTVSGVMVNGECYGAASVKVGKETYYGTVYID